jgi:hypothetical protein
MKLDFGDLHFANPPTRYPREAGATSLPLIEDLCAESKPFQQQTDSLSDLPKIPTPSGTMEIQAGNRSLAKGKTFLP